jgi:hypothetical protein
MTLEVERKAERARELLDRPEVREAMRIRCEQDGHSWQDACSPLLQIYKVCDWCGARR